MLQRAMFAKDTAAFQGLRVGLLLALLAVGACATAPFPPELTEKAQSQPAFATLQQDPIAYQGSTVILGGTILKTIARQDHTDIEVLQKPLDGDYEPQGVEVAEGRFLARCNKFLDPAIFKPGRDISIAGEVEGKEQRALGEVLYSYPVISCKKTQLWPSRNAAYAYRPQPAWYDWYGSPYWPAYYDSMERRLPR